jgi:hypothetical protein
MCILNLLSCRPLEILSVLEESRPLPSRFLFINCQIPPENGFEFEETSDLVSATMRHGPVEDAVFVLVCLDSDKRKAPFSMQHYPCNDCSA